MSEGIMSRGDFVVSRRNRPCIILDCAGSTIMPLQISSTKLIILQVSPS